MVNEKEDYMEEVIKKRQEKRKSFDPKDFKITKPNRKMRRGMMSKSNSLATLYKKIGKLKALILEIDSHLDVIKAAPALALSTDQVIYLQDLCPKLQEDEVHCPHCRGIYKKKGLKTHLKSCKVLKADLYRIEEKKIVKEENMAQKFLAHQNNEK